MIVLSTCEGNISIGSAMLRIPRPADILLESSPNIHLTEVFLAGTGEQIVQVHRVDAIVP